MRWIVCQKSRKNKNSASVATMSEKESIMQYVRKQQRNHELEIDYNEIGYISDGKSKLRRTQPR